MTKQSAEEHNALSQMAAMAQSEFSMASTDALLETLKKFYAKKNQQIEDNNSEIKRLKAIKVDKEQVNKFAGYWSLSKLEATKILRQQDCDIDKAMMFMMTK